MTILGYLALAIGLLCFVLSETWLFRLCVFWTLFSASSAINFGDRGTGSALPVWMLLGLLWLFRKGIKNLPTLHFAIDRRIFQPCMGLILFVLLACVSLLMPLYIDGRLLITSPMLGDNSRTPLYLTSHNVTQLLYLLFGVLMAINVAHLTMQEEERQGTERTILYSAIFISLWGAFQFVCNSTGMHYPDFIFNNSASPFARGFRQSLDIGVGRLSSVALEPSFFAQSLVTLLPLTIPAWLGKGSVLSPAMDRVTSVLFIVMLILSTSFTAYLGFMAIAVLFIPISLKTHSVQLGKVAKVGFGAGAAIAASIGILLAVVSSGSEVLGSILLNKVDSASGLERLMTIELAFGYFRQYPLLGVGWGSVTSHDLIVFLLSNVGLIGAIAFFGCMMSIIVNSWKRLGLLNNSHSVSHFSWLFCLSVFLLTSIASGFPLVAGNFWVIAGMAIGTGCRQEECG